MINTAISASVTTKRRNEAGGATAACRKARSAGSPQQAERPVEGEYRFEKSQHRRVRASESMVPRRGLEPPRCYPLVPETSASTNSATRAWLEQLKQGLGSASGFPLSMKEAQRRGGALTAKNRSSNARFPPIFRRPSGRHSQGKHGANSARPAGDDLRRLGLCRPPSGTRARQTRLAHPRRRPPARSCGPSPAAWRGRSDPCGPGEPCAIRTRSRARPRVRTRS